MSGRNENPEVSARGNRLVVTIISDRKWNRYIVVTYMHGMKYYIYRAKYPSK